MNPILLDIPEEFTSDRLIIRAPRFGDGGEMNAVIQETAEDLQPWMPWAMPVPTVEQSEENVRRAVARWKLREDLRLHLFLKSTGEFVGGSGLHRINWDVPRFEIGYWIGKKFTGQGLITEAVNRITRFAFEELSAARVEIRCDVMNLKSSRVAERAGFELDGILRNDTRTPGGDLRSTRVYSKIQPINM
jgi:RimJ/RimL family protein N-acetyltransferase